MNVAARVRHVLSAIVRLRESLADGDLVFAATRLESLEEDVVDLVDELEGRAAVRRGSYVCVICGGRFRWPGELDDHDRNVHWAEPWRRTA